MLKTPATQAATYSPTLWPITYAGVTPHDVHNWTSAHSRAKNTALPNST